MQVDFSNKSTMVSDGFIGEKHVSETFRLSYQKESIPLAAPTRRQQQVIRVMTFGSNHGQTWKESGSSKY
jgi:hypothetical protein